MLTMEMHNVRLLMCWERLHFDHTNHISESKVKIMHSKTQCWDLPQDTLQSSSPNKRLVKKLPFGPASPSLPLPPPTSSASPASPASPVSPASPYLLSLPLPPQPPLPLLRSPASPRLPCYPLPQQHTLESLTDICLCCCWCCSKIYTCVFMWAVCEWQYNSRSHGTRERASSAQC